jgi:hypothetical protein
MLCCPSSTHDDAALVACFLARNANENAACNSS